MRGCYVLSRRCIFEAGVGAKRGEYPGSSPLHECVVAIHVIGREVWVWEITKIRVNYKALPPRSGGGNISRIEVPTREVNGSSPERK